MSSGRQIEWAPFADYCGAAQSHPAVHNPKNQRQNDADYQTSNPRKVDRSLFAAPNDVARQLTQWQVQFINQQNDDAQCGEHEPRDDEQTSQVHSALMLNALAAINWRWNGFIHERIEIIFTNT